MEIDNYENRVDDVLQKLHMDINKVGYKYLKLAIVNQYKDYNAELRCVFRIIGHMHGVSYKSVESGIKRCIKDGIVKCPKHAKIEVFGYDIEENRICGRNYYTPTEFIIHIMNYLHKTRKL